VLRSCVLGCTRMRTSQYLPFSRHFQGQESGKQESLETQLKLYFSLTDLKFAKNPILYGVRLLWYYMENAK